MYNELIKKLKEVGVVFDKGLDNKEIKNIQSIYDIEFPRELKDLYMRALPISKGFYNWRDFDEKNINKMRKLIQCPTLDIKQNTKNIDWNDLWGEEPEDVLERNTIIIKKIDEASALIPIFGHRFISNQYEEGNPVFSICDTDIICYGANLIEYFQIEFKYKNLTAITYENIKHVNFWSDLL